MIDADSTLFLERFVYASAHLAHPNRVQDLLIQWAQSSMTFEEEPTVSAKRQHLRSYPFSNLFLFLGSPWSRRPLTRVPLRVPLSRPTWT
jgi:hypothetical protein